MSKCAGCCDGFKEGDTITTCCVCLNLFHCNEKTSEGSGKNCSGVTTSEIRVIKLKSKTLMVYRCADCTKNGGDNPRIVEVISDLQASVNKLSSISKDIEVLTKVQLPKIEESVTGIKASVSKLKGKLNEHINGCSTDINSIKCDVAKLQENFNSLNNVDLNASAVLNSSANSQLIMEEIDNRRIKENNIIILNVKEQVLKAGEKLDKDHDLNLVKNLLSGIHNISTTLHHWNVKRLGAFNANKVRPILVCFDIRNDVVNVLTHWRLIPKPYIVSYDLTKNQREHYNRLRSEAKTFNENQVNKDNNVKQIVKFRNGNPLLVTIHPKSKSNLENL